MREDAEGRGAELHRDLGIANRELGIDGSSGGVDSHSDTHSGAEPTACSFGTTRKERGDSRSARWRGPGGGYRRQEENCAGRIHDSGADIACRSDADIDGSDGENLNRSARWRDAELTFLEGEVTAYCESTERDESARRAIGIRDGLGAEEWTLLELKDGGLGLATGIDEVEGLIDRDSKRVDLEAEIRSEASADLIHESLRESGRSAELPCHALLGDEDASEAIAEEDAHIISGSCALWITEENGDIGKADADDLHIGRRRGLLEEEDGLDGLTEDGQGNWSGRNIRRRSNAGLHLKERPFLNIDRHRPSTANLDRAHNTSIGGVDLEENVICQELNILTQSRREADANEKVSRDSGLGNEDHSALDGGRDEDFIAIAQLESDILQRDHDLAHGGFLEDEVSSETLAENFEEDARSGNREPRNDGHCWG